MVAVWRYRSAKIGVYEKVFWEGSDGSKANLLGYLDLSQALTTPSRKAVCQRALLRTWHFFAPGAQFVPSDTLLTGLLPEETIVGGGADNTDKAIVHVGSVLVSGSTVSLKLRRVKGSSLHLFRHGHIQPEDPNFSDWVDEPVALEWMRDAPELLPPPPGTLPYERIPGTPFIGRGGAKTIPIRRFNRSQNIDYGHFDRELSFYGEPPQEMYDHFLLCGALKFGHWKYGGHHDLFTLNLGKVYRLEHNSKGPLVDWLTETFKSINKACMLVYPSHPVTDTIIRDLQLKFLDCMPKQVIPVNFLGVYSQSSIRIPSLTYDRIRKILEAQTGEIEIILFDDGIISGKVARELEQLIRNANIHGHELTIHIVTLVTRTGLPLYRRLIEKTRDHNHHYWRWDVPALGNRRMCPLCNALGKASLLSASFPEGDAKKHIKNWIKQWECKDVGTDWESHGINPRPLPSIREMTFGKEWIPGKEAIAYTVKHSTTTGLAAMVVELLRITSYKAVGLQFADEPWGKNLRIHTKDKNTWKHASFEILTGQLLLFFDDFDFDELTYRYERLFKLLIEDEYNDEICSLARLTLLLAEPDHAVFILKAASNSLAKKEIHSLDGLITLGDIQTKCFEIQPKLIPELKEKAGNSNRILSKNLNYSWYTLSGIEKDPYYKQRNAFRMLILLLGDSIDTMHHAYLRDRLTPPLKANVQLIIRDLKLLSLSLNNIRKEMYLTPPSKGCMYSDDIKSINIDEFASKNKDNIDKMSSLLEGVTNEQKETEVVELNERLFGEKTGVSICFQRNFLASPDEILQEIERKIKSSDWQELIEKKSKKTPDLLKRWKVNYNSITPPKIIIEVKEESYPIIVCPPIVRQFLRDRFLNVIHSSESFVLGNKEETDMLCNITLKEQNVLFTFMNCTASKNKPQQGPVASIIDDFLQKDFVSYQIEEKNGSHFFIATVVIPTVKGIGERNG